MKKSLTNESYSSPRVEQLALACEQAVMSASVSGVDNEGFQKGGSFTDWE